MPLPTEEELKAQVEALRAQLAAAQHECHCEDRIYDLIMEVEILKARIKRANRER